MDSSLILTPVSFLSLALVVNCVWMLMLGEIMSSFTPYPYPLTMYFVSRFFLMQLMILPIL